jgi:hypothetical protein
MDNTFVTTVEEIFHQSVGCFQLDDKYLIIMGDASSLVNKFLIAVVGAPSLGDKYFSYFHK